MRIKTTLAVSAAALVASASLVAPTTASAAECGDRADVSSHLATQLGRLDAGAPTAVMVHGATLQQARDAVAATGMTAVTSFDRIGVVVATGTATQVQAVRSEPGVTYVEGNQGIDLFQDTSNTATRGYEATQTLTGADGQKLTGNGVSVAVIDSGVDPTHPYFEEADGSSAVVANLKTLCDPLEAFCSVQEVPNSVDTDTLSVGGHGTHVNGIVAGNPVTLDSGKELQGAAPGAKLVSLSTGAGLFIIGADAALNWVLENHAAPVRRGRPGRRVPADQGHQQLLRPQRRRRVRPAVGHRQAAARARGRGRRDRLGQRQRRRRRLGEPLQPARHGPHRRHHLGGVVLRPGHRHP